MVCPAGGDLWLTTIMHHRSPVSQPQAAVWALGSFGRGLARSWTLSTVGRLLAAGMQRPEQTVRQRRRAWEDDAARKRGATRPALRVETGCAPVLGGVVRGWQGTPLALARDVPTWGPRGRNARAGRGRARV